MKGNIRGFNRCLLNSAPAVSVTGNIYPPEKQPVLVVSKDFFNTSGEIIGCTIIRNSIPGPLHIWISTEVNEGYVQCENEKLALLDLTVRGYKKTDRLPISEMMNISDAIQGIFESI